MNRQIFLLRSILLLMFPALVFSLDEKALFESVSENNEFLVQSYGFYYEGFHGEQQITLIRLPSDTLWETSLESVAEPIVSNNGEVAAFLRNSIEFYNCAGQSISTFQPDDASYMWYSSDSYRSPCEKYSPDGKYFVTFTTKAKHHREPSISFLDNTGKVHWQYDLGLFYPSHIQYLKNMLIIDDFRMHSRDDNNVYIFTYEGKLIHHFILENLRGSARPYFDQKTNMIYFYLKDGIRRYSLSDSSIFEYPSLEKIFPIFFSDDIEDLYFVVEFLFIQKTVYSFDEKTLQRLKELANYENKYYKGGSSYIRKYSREILKNNSLE